MADIQSLLDILPQLGNQPSSAGPLPPMNFQNQSAPQAPQLDPNAQAILQQSLQTPEDLFQKYRRQYFGDPEGKAEPTKKQRIKKGVLEALRGLLEPGYTNMPERLRAQAEKDFQLQTPRLQVAAPLERLQQQLQQAAIHNEYLNQELERKKAYDAEKGKNSEDRNANQLFGLQSRDAIGRMGLDIRRDLNDQQRPLTQARTGLINQQTKNAEATQGLGGLFGYAQNYARQAPDFQKSLDNALKTGRDNSRFPPGSGSGAGGASNRIFQNPFTIFNTDSGELESSNKLTAVNPKTLQVQEVGTIAKPAGSLDPKDVEKVNDFGSAATMARQLANNIAQVVKTGKSADFMGLLQGNGLSVASRASGVFGTSKSFNESLFQILKANGLFQHISSFAGKRITNRELDYMNKYLGKQTDSPESAMSAAVAASQLLEVAQLQKAKVLPDDYNPTPAMQAENARFMGELGYGLDKNGDYVKVGPAKDNPTLRSMRSVLNGQGALRKTGSSAPAKTDTPADEDPDMVKLRKAVQERLGKK